MDKNNWMIIISALAVLSLTISLYTLFSTTEPSVVGAARYGNNPVSLSGISTLINSQCFQGVKNCGYVTSYSLNNFKQELENKYIEKNQIKAVFNDNKLTCEDKCSSENKECLFGIREGAFTCDKELKGGGRWCICV